MPTELLVVGDSVPPGEATDAAGWPRRLPSLVDGLDAERVAVTAGMGQTLNDLAVECRAAVDDAAPAAGDLVVLVHAGHNDAQLSGGDPRVSVERFRAAAARTDRRLADHPAVDRHAFVGLVPLLPGHGVPFADAQPGRSLDYDDALAETVETHLPVARPVEAWADRTADGVHPAATGHAAIAERDAAWLER